MATRLSTALGTLATTIEAISPDYPVGTSDAFDELPGRLPEDVEPDTVRHRGFRFFINGSGTGERITSGERDLVRSVRLSVHYDANLALGTVEKMMASDEELLIVRLEKEANRPTGISYIRFTGSTVDRADRNRPVLHLDFEVVQGLSQTL